MKNTGFNYEFTMRELAFFLLGKKVCPKCGNKLVRKKECEIRTDLFHTRGADSVFKPGSEIKQYSFKYTCSNCGFSKSLKELAERSNTNL